MLQHHSRRGNALQGLVARPFAAQSADSDLTLSFETREAPDFIGV
jgi:hypothetical protein